MEKLYLYLITSAYRRTWIVVILLIFILDLGAQPFESKMSLGLGLQYERTKVNLPPDYYAGYEVRQITQSLQTFITPGFFVADGWVVGLTYAYLGAGVRYKSSAPEEVFDNNGFKIRGNGAGVFFKKYFTISDQFHLLIANNLTMFKFNDISDGDWSRILDFNGQIGVNYMLGRMGLEVSTVIFRQDKEVRKREERKYSSSNFEFGLNLRTAQLGITYFF